METKRNPRFNFTFTTIPVPVSFDNSYSVVTINSSEDKFAVSYSLCPNVVNGNVFELLLALFGTFIQYKKENENISALIRNFDKNRKIPFDIANWREIFIFLSHVLISNSINEAYENYYQTEKRCAIRDYWQWIVHEIMEEECEDENFEEGNRDIETIVDLDNNLIIPIDFINPERFLLEDYGFDPRDGIWKRLKYKSLPCQRGDINNNYNRKTSVFYEFSSKSTLYKFQLKRVCNNEAWLYHKYAMSKRGTLYKVGLDHKLTAIIATVLKHIKNYLDNLENKNHEPLPSIISQSHGLQDLIKEILNDEIQSKFLFDLISFYFPKPEQFQIIE